MDEAHQGQSGENARILKGALADLKVARREWALDQDLDEEQVDLTDDYIRVFLDQGKHKNQSFFAFTATPKAETLELFGTRIGRSQERRPFHIYSMRQAIEEGFILDVLAHYTTLQEAFQLAKVSNDNPELIEDAAQRALIRYYRKHGHTIRQKTEIMMENFLENGRWQIGGCGKAMVIADSRANAVRYFFAIQQYLKEHAEKAQGCGVMVAFSGEVTVEEYPREYPFTEANLNRDAEGRSITTDAHFRKTFHSPDFNILVVANKYQTGFDEPLLHSMYVDKKLRDISAVQTLSRLNRAYAGKSSTLVLDFANTADDIRKAFKPYYETTRLDGETDVNSVYDRWHDVTRQGICGMSDVELFSQGARTYYSGKRPTHHAAARVLDLFRPVIERFVALEKDERSTFRTSLTQFVNAYTFVTQLIRLSDPEIFECYNYASQLLILLPREKSEELDLDEKVVLEYVKLQETFHGAIQVNEKAEPFNVKARHQPRPPSPTTDTLASIIARVNEHFQGDFGSTTASPSKASLVPS